MSRNYGIKEIAGWQFDRLALPTEWAAHFGQVTENFRMLIEGKPGHGKTEYVIRLAKALAIHYGKVHFNSTEQGKSATLQQAFTRNNIADEVPSGKLMLADAGQRTFEGWFRKVQKPNSGKVLILDSLDYMHLTFEQYQRLHERFPRKALIIVCWNDPMDTHAKRIRYTCDLKVEVKDFVARVRSRFGGNRPYLIRGNRPAYGTQLTLL